MDEKLVFNSDLNLAKSPVVNIAASLGHGPYALGYQTAFDSGKSALTKHNLALNYNAGDMILHATSSGCKFALDKDAAIRAKVDTNSQIGVSYQQKLRDGVTVTLSSNIDGTKLNQPGHKLGLCLEMEA